MIKINKNTTFSIKMDLSESLFIALKQIARTPCLNR